MSATIAIAEGIAIITMDDGKANAVNPAMVAALNACLDRAEREARAVVLAGRAQRFCGGFDLKLMAAARAVALSGLAGPAFAATKRLLRRHTLEVVAADIGSIS